MSTIYRIVNKVNGQSYIGQTKQKLEIRTSGLNNYRKCRKLQNAFDMFGKENFYVEELEKCPDDMADNRERYYISFFDTVNNGYNLCNGGKKNFNYCEESVMLLSKSRKGQRNSPETEFKKGQVSPNKGKHLSAESKIKLSLNHKGKHNSPSTEFTSERMSGSNNTRAYPVYQFDMEGNFIARFNTAKEASEKTGIRRQLISSCRTGRLYSAGNYRWSAHLSSK